MERSDSMAESPRRRNRLLRDQVQLVKRKDINRYEIVPFPEPLSFEKGLFFTIHAIQLLGQHNEGITFVGVAGSSGAGKTMFTEKVLNFMPGVAVMSMDDYNDASRLVDGNFDDYDTLLENIHGLKEGRSVQVPVNDFKMRCQTGHRTVDVPVSRIVIIEGIYALSDKLRPILDLHVSISGGVQDLVKRVLWDMQRAGKVHEEIIHQVYPMYKAFIEPDLKTAHIRIINKFNPFSGFQNPMYILKSPRSLTPDQIKAALGEDQKESNEETYELYLRPHAIPLEYLRKITNNFSDKRILGKGGSGVVYKGVLQNGETIAVKKIVSSLMPGLQKQFENEVSHLMELKHANIVRCVGYCYEIKKECLEYNGKYVFAEMAERLLCLEYMPNGSLDKYISDESSGLDWSTRYRIIEGICYGLCHLHEQNGKPIIHLDLKPANILLGDGMVPKITDFGLSRLLDRQHTICTTSRDGTFGYMAPEFLHGGTITPKSDIFSLGVIIMEIVTGHRDYPDVTRTSSDEFIQLVSDKWKDVFQRSAGNESIETDCQQIERCIQVGLNCVNPDRTKRPPIANIINMLQGPESINCDTSIEAA